MFLFIELYEEKCRDYILLTCLFKVHIPQNSKIPLQCKRQYQVNTSEMCWQLVGFQNRCVHCIIFRMNNCSAYIMSAIILYKDVTLAVGSHSCRTWTCLSVITAHWDSVMKAWIKKQLTWICRQKMILMACKLRWTSQRQSSILQVDCNAAYFSGIEVRGNLLTFISWL